MLNGSIKLGERVSTGPGSAWFQNRLWLAYGDLNGLLTLRSVDVNGAGLSTRFPTSIATGISTAATAMGDRLYVLYGTGGEGYFLTTTVDGNNFSPPALLPIPGFTGVGGLTSSSGRLVILWAENAGGQAHLLTSDDGGSTFDDTTLPYNVLPVPAITAHPDGTELWLAFGARQGGPRSFTLAAIDPSDPTITRRYVTTDTPTGPGSVSICPSLYRNQPGLHVAVQYLDAGGSGPTFGRSAPATLASVGGEEPFGNPAIELSLTFDGKHAWAAWRAGGSDADELMVGPYLTVFDLPEELQSLLGEKCDPENCPVDPRLVCAATEEVVWDQVPAKVRNAKRGDLVLTPGDGTGLIATMLNQLEPGQHFDHMGIMIRDQDLVRHATMAHDRIKERDPGHYMTGSLFGKKAPVNGFRPDVLKFGWPGTITQSVEDAFYTGFHTNNPATDRPYNAQGDFFALNPGVAALPFPARDDPEAIHEAWRNQHRFADPENPSGKTYRIANLPNTPAYLKESGVIIDPVVVKPLPTKEAADPRIRTMLHRVAEAAEKIHGHYRFFSYSKAAIALDPTMFGPLSGDPFWTDHNPGAAWCAGTAPVVCSSFVWMAIQLANAAFPLLEVEGTATEDPEERLPSPPMDGLYRYLTDERRNAATALHDLLEENVRKQAYQALQQAVHENGLAIDLTTIGIVGLIALLSGPVAAAAVFLGVTPETILDLKLLIEDMPDDVATQMCNTFAWDRSDETDEDLWDAPGEGVGVSPDDILHFWDAPEPASNREFWHGLYGHSEKLLLTPRRFEPIRIHRWDRSPGPAFVQGRVLYRGEPVEGAEVRFGCEKTMTSVRDLRRFREPIYQLELSAGHYDAHASVYWTTTQELLAGRLFVEIQPGDQPGFVDIELEDPPDWRRLVHCTGKIDVVRKVVMGTDDWAHSSINLQSTLVKAPTSFSPPPPSDATFDKWTAEVVSDFAQRFNVRVDIEVSLHDDLSITVLARSALCENYYDHARPANGDEIVTSDQFSTGKIPPGGSGRIIFDHNSGNFPPDRGHVEFKVENQRAPA